MMMRRETLAAVCWAAMLYPAQLAAQALPVEIKVPDETIPAGGTVQLKFQLTEPRPIMTGTKSFAMDEASFDSIFGVALFSPLGDAFGVAQYGKGGLSVRYLSPLGSFGTVVDYPVLTVAAHIRATAPLGQQSFVTLSAGSMTDALGQTLSFVQNRPGIVTVGGKLSIHNVVPGGGTWPAGALVKVYGTGFSGSGVKVTPKFRTKQIQIVSDTEINLILDRATTLDTQSITIQQRDKLGTAQVTYFSYLRPVEFTKSSYAAVASTIPIFPLASAQSANVLQAGPGLNGGTLTALAVANKNAGPIKVELTASTAFGRIAQATIFLAPGEKMTRELGEYFGTTLPIGATVRAEGTLPLEFVAFQVDQLTGAATPIVVF